MAASLLFLSASLLCLLQSASSFSGPSTCHPDSAFFLYNLQSQCPPSISLIPPLQVDGTSTELALSGKERMGYTSILFYASQCPFSRSVLPKFEILSSMFPQIEHVMFEQSSALPSIFSRYGIHSLPTILLVNQTSRVKYHGSKDLLSLAQFYERSTGFVRVQYFSEDQKSSLRADEELTMNSLIGLSVKEISGREPYLVLSVLFLCLRILLSLFPEVVSRVRAFLSSYGPHLNLQIFGETSQLMGRVLHVIDVRRIGARLRLCKARSFHERARSAQVWASSLASVSLGESSSARSSSLGLN